MLNFMQKLKKILYLLSPKERKNANLLLIMIIIMALLDMIGVASILPFMAVLTNPDLIQTNMFLNTMFHASSIFAVENNQQFLFALGVLVFLTLVFSLIFKAITVYLQLRFVQMREYTIGKKLIERYLSQPYSWFLDRHSADLGKTILSEVSLVISTTLNPMMELIAKGMVAIALISLLIITNPKLSLIVGLVLCGCYFFIFFFTRTYLNQIGNERLKNNELRFTSVSEAFGAAKEVKVGGLENIFIQRFSNSAQTFAHNQASALVINQLPRFVLEVIAFGSVLMVILYLMKKTGDFNNAIPILSLYVYAGYRLIPALQGIYSSLSTLTFGGPSLDRLYDDIKNLKSSNSNNDHGNLTFKELIALKNIHYSYPNSMRTTLKNIDISIPAKTTVGFVGTTGSGKTTTADIILGLLEGQKGTLEVDRKIINKHNNRAWQKSIGYVPQHIYLSDDTIAGNIAFGVEPEDINHEAVEQASKISNLHEFVTSELPKKYQTKIGERGVRLSGGQRQRIGIARALYHNPKVLILDEATSALDNQTEKAVMDAVNNLNKSITIIIITHRLSTVKNCDKIYLFDKGEIKNEGTFKELIKLNNNFRMNVNN
jgi:ABC-type multidrug transport system fused ATPase/permease subunit